MTANSRPGRVPLTPTFEEWLAAARAEARESLLPVQAILISGERKRACPARWRAWRRLLQKYPEYPIKGLARTTGFDHTSILYGLKRLKKMEANLEMAHNPPR